MTIVYNTMYMCNAEMMYVTSHKVCSLINEVNTTKRVTQRRTHQSARDVTWGTDSAVMHPLYSKWRIHYILGVCWSFNTPLRQHSNNRKLFQCHKSSVTRESENQYITTNTKKPYKPAFSLQTGLQWWRKSEHSNDHYSYVVRMARSIKICFQLS